MGHSFICSYLFSDANLYGKTHEGVLVPESISQVNGAAHQKDSHKDRQLSGQNQNGHLRPALRRGRRIPKAFQRVDQLREMYEDKRL